MLIKLRNKKGQSTLEYVILVVIVLAALLTIQSYVKRGIQGRTKSAVDDIGDQYSATATNHTVITVTNSRGLESSSALGSSSAVRTVADGGLAGGDRTSVTETIFTNNTQSTYAP